MAAEPSEVAGHDDGKQGRRGHVSFDSQEPSAKRRSKGAPSPGAQVHTDAGAGVWGAARPARGQRPITRMGVVKQRARAVAEGLLGRGPDH
ncbi:MAG: hypothetical protein GEU90_15195 [Gemmatimonas sp.]|nr:hypothetical protein [Gemmatimonas sp.]